MSEPSSLDLVVKKLCDNGHSIASRRFSGDAPMPSVDTLSEIVEDLRSVLFPGYYGRSEITPETLPYYVGSTLDRVERQLADQINRGYCFVCDREGKELCKDCEERSRRTAREFIAKLPTIRDMLLSDVEAAYDGDPAAKTHGETIFCYPSIRRSPTIASPMNCTGSAWTSFPESSAKWLTPTRESTSIPARPSANGSSSTTAQGPSSARPASSERTSGFIRV